MIFLLKFLLSFVVRSSTGKYFVQALQYEVVLVKYVVQALQYEVVLGSTLCKLCSTK